MDDELRPHPYLTAARRVALSADDFMQQDKSTACCSALLNTTATSDQRYEFNFLFGYGRGSLYWWKRPLTHKPSSWVDQEARVLALLFAYWMAVEP